MTATTTNATTSRPRRTQAQRRAETRARLLEAATQCLAEHGYAAMTLPEVVARAGVSNGALWGHFRSKAELAVAAVAGSGAGGAGASDTDATPSALLVAQLIGDPRDVGYRARLALLRAAAVDDDVWAALADATDQHERDLHSADAALGHSEQLDQPTAAAVHVLGLAAAALELWYRRDPLRHAVLLDELKQVAARLLDEVPT